MTDAKTTNPHIIQHTNVEADERYYCRSLDGETTEYAPSYTHCSGICWPDTSQLARWRGDVGNKHADEIMRDAAEEGSYVHHGIEAMFAGGEIPSNDIRDAFDPRRSLKVLRCLAGFLDWCDEYHPEPEKLEAVTWQDDPLCAGTVDFVGHLTVKGERSRWVVDWKTGKSIYDSAKAQVAWYHHSETQTAIASDGPDAAPQNAGILHLGNTKLKTRTWSFLDVTPYLNRFTPQALAIIRTFHLHNPNARPSAEQFPEVFSLPEKE